MLKWSGGVMGEEGWRKDGGDGHVGMIVGYMQFYCQW